MSAFHPSAFEDLLAGKAQSRLVGGELLRGSRNRTPVIFPGAFNPLHEGHLKMAALAERLLNEPVAFELSVMNVDKSPLSAGAVSRRVAQFSEQQAVWITRAATFVEKARLFGAPTFVVGADTIVRIGDSRYYGDCEKQRDRVVAELVDLSCRFLVFGRKLKVGFRDLDQLDVPAGLRSISRGLDEATFRQDISSTHLRRSMEG